VEMYLVWAHPIPLASMMEVLKLPPSQN